MFAWTPLILDDISPPHTLPLPDSRCPQLELGALLSLEKGIPRACTEPLRCLVTIQLCYLYKGLEGRPLLF